ncbi:hypothetical protein FRB91_004628 [Serendipita sp. 411]|nr:hypothetical protein FRB91_004628 [Serendipita sp. 411]
MDRVLELVQVHSRKYYVSIAALLAASLLAKRAVEAMIPTGRSKRIPPSSERVLIIGASSGVGKSIAMLYAARGTKRVCIVGRRLPQLKQVKEECLSQSRSQSQSRDHGSNEEDNDHILVHVADATRVEDLVALRERLEEEWGGIDTVHICAGVSSLRPLLDVAGSPYASRATTVEGIKHAQSVALKAIEGNFTAPLLVALTFIPQLQRTSSLPAILLVSSLAALVPAPTRSLYAASKSSSLMLFRSLAIEHPKIQFSYICPGTIEGNFRASAVDGGDVREVLEGALKVEVVAKRCIKMVDRSERLVIIPWKYAAGFVLSWLFPRFVEKKAREKYGFDGDLPN